MSSNNRRDFLRLAAQSAGAMAAYAGFPPAIRNALAMPAAYRTGTIRDVEHVVIFMQENRSFDHYFGGLRGVRGFDDPRPHLLPNGAPVWQQPPASVFTKNYHSRGLDPSAPYVLPFYLDPKQTTEFQPGTNHGWSSGHLSWNNGQWDQWVNQKQDVLTMGYLKRQDLTYHYALADAFTICDSYFCSAHADTAPNRIYLWTGTVDSRNVYGSAPNGPGIGERNDVNGYTWTTYAERLEDAKISWKVYQGGTGIPGDPTDNYTDNSLMFFKRFQVKEGASGPLVDKGASNHTLAELKADVQANRLPQVSWIVSPYKYSEHPQASPTDGAFYINMVLEALTSNPEVWAKTVFILNYDENDGLFDHVVPPVPPVTSGVGGQGIVSSNLLSNLGDELLDLNKYPGEMSPLVPGADPGGIQPIGLGPRVPLIIISPWTKGGWVCSETFDHTSVLRFLEARFGVKEPNISAWRRSICGDLTSAFDFSARPDTRTVSFTVPQHIATAGQAYQVPAQQSMPAQEPGTRPARALPYELFVHSRVGAHDDTVSLDFANTGDAGAAFYVYDRRNPATPPRRYAVSAHDRFVDTWSTSAARGEYHLAAYGPNGYLCEFQGNTRLAADGRHANPEAKIGYDVRNRHVYLQLRNSGRATCRVTVDNAYSQAQARTYTLEPGERVEEHFELSSSHGWYDLTITATTLRGGDDKVVRRFAGHVETGRPSHSDPGPVKRTA
ncbi:phosphocholine-specific phospholipase C [Burkholderia sp. MSMB2157WGS]|uniref:phosphocholine-specific phospholipase C n=1 Tax=Burkholderia sp. MSMB2157WGS TaxID=1637928 RepID=UPI000753CDF3|nr:phospholipase C, phosphocholine-specific [Burkholderia sp. MSMB2157WGS]KWE63881.1 phospholipase C, phosphocholine-specific [Burkholderia sp. MSMB2157WGS]